MEDGEDEDLKNFDPKKFWSIENNEQGPSRDSRKDSKNVEKIIRFLKHEHFISEVEDEFNMNETSVNKYMVSIRAMKGVALERKDCKGRYTYRIDDFRKIKPRF